MTFHDFLKDKAKFPFPPSEPGSASMSSPKITRKDILKLRGRWKATHAIRDPHLFDKLCHTLETILGNKLLDSLDTKNSVTRQYLPELFSPQIERYPPAPDRLLPSMWQRNNGLEEEVRIFESSL